MDDICTIKYIFGVNLKVLRMQSSGGHNNTNHNDNVTVNDISLLKFKVFNYITITLRQLRSL